MECEQLYPLWLKLAGQRCLVVGGGVIAADKVSGLLECDAIVSVRSPLLEDRRLQSWAESGRIEWLQGCYAGEIPPDCRLVIAATDDQEVNHQIAEDARESGCLVNTVDDPDYCDFYVPAMIRRGDLLVAIGTGGRAPGLSRWLRRYLEARLPEGIAELLDEYAAFRERLRQIVPDVETRMAIHRDILASGAIEDYLNAEPEKLRNLIHDTLTAHQRQS